MAYCESCRAWFNQTARYQTLCKPCFARRKRAEFEAMEVRALRAEYALRDALRENRELRTVAGRQGIEPEMLRRLIMLCHPDRHGGSDASHRATQWLLEQRGHQ